MLTNRLLRLEQRIIKEPLCFIRTGQLVQPTSYICRTKYNSSKGAKAEVSKKSTRIKYENVHVYPRMTVQELATAMEKDVDHIFECLLYIDNAPRVDNENSVLNTPTIKEICLKSGIRAVPIGRPAAQVNVDVTKDISRRPPADPASCLPRPPVVTIMGHVDHGKTTLLDYLRKSNVVDQEFGGITQHIGAFSVPMKHGKSITFLDTPGHAAFSSMRGRGASMTDIIVLVVAADDGVMPQTIESIKHAMTSQVPVIVAMNKCDRVEAEVEACMEDLAGHGVMLEELGGDVMGVQISALKGTNIDALQDMIITQAELLDIRADPTGFVEASVIESKTEPGRGKVASLLVQRGTLKAGSWLVAGTSFAKVKSMYDENRKVVKAAGPGIAVEVMGWKELPSPGDDVLQVENESRVKEILAYRQLQERKSREEEAWSQIREKRREHNSLHAQKLQRRHAAGKPYYTLDLKAENRAFDAMNQTVEEVKPELSLIIKADVDGSLEAITSCLATYNSDLCVMETISSGVGVVSENDVELANDFNGVVIAFNTTISPKVNALAQKLNVTIRNHNIIYKLIDDVKDLLNERIPAAIEHKTVGEALVQKVFVVTEKIDGKNRKVSAGGCKCTQGTLFRHKLYKVIRGGEVVHSGPLHMLKHFKAEVEDIRENMECGLALADFSVDLKPDDTLLCYEEHEYQPQVHWNLPF